MRRSTRSSPTSRSSGRPAPVQVLVMAKYPSPGAVKTRLGAQIGARAACRLYQAFIHDLAERLVALRFPVTWAFWPPDAPFAQLVPGQRCVPQVGRDLGERLEAAIRDCIATVRLPVLVIGADAPHVDATSLREAAQALGGGADVVLGPATDGGYYLIGLGNPSAELFRDVPWGSSTVLEVTLERARARGLRVHLLPPTFDVDDEGGLDALRTLLAGGAIALPHTAAALASVRGRTAPYS
jgi:rSAM/selenodomain-associated transferase 1